MKNRLPVLKVFFVFIYFMGAACSAGEADVESRDPGASSPSIARVPASDASAGTDLSEAALRSAEPDSSDIARVVFEAEKVESIRSLLIQKRGEVIVEHYTGSMNAQRPTNIKSASKSILSLLIGIAVDQGIIENVEQTVGDYFPDYFEVNPDPVKESITILDLLTMRTGLETTSFRNYGRWVLSNDWVHFALDQPMEQEPGGRMVYSTGTSHLLSVILTKASGMSTRQFAVRHLFGPMDIEPGGWDRDPQGYYMGGNNMALKPGDMLKIGELILNGGAWNGNQIISKEWLEESFQTYTRSNFNPYDYGYMWWKRPIGGYESIFAWGNGGQYLFIFPELDGVVVITSTADEATPRRRYREPVFTLIEEEIIPKFFAGS